MKEVILLIVGIVLLIVSWFFVCFLYYKKKLTEKAMVEIISLEELNIPGEERMKTLVGKLCELLPTAIRVWIPEEWIRLLAQSLFDLMKQFAIRSIEKKKNLN